MIKYPRRGVVSMPWINGGTVTIGRGGFAGINVPDLLIVGYAIEILNAPDINPREYGYLSVWTATGLVTGTIAAVAWNDPIWHPNFVRRLPTEERAGLRQMRFKHSRALNISLQVRFHYNTG